MKRAAFLSPIAAVALLLLLLTGGVARADKYALCIGIHRYEDMNPLRGVACDALHRCLDAQMKLAILYARDGLYDRAETLLAEVANADAANPLCAQAARLRQDIRRQRQKAAQSGH